MAVLLPVQAGAICTKAPLFVTGHSLEPLVHDGESVNGWLGDCGKDPQRGDLVLFTHLGVKVPLLKIVLGTPGDRFGLVADGDGLNLLINGAVATNAEGAPYRLARGNDDILRLYLKGTRGTIPPNAWLVMGDNPAGTDDSSRFGLIPRADIIGGAARPAAPVR
jgi:signal peptidase I